MTRGGPRRYLREVTIDSGGRSRRTWCVTLVGRTRWTVALGDAGDREAALAVRRDVYRADLRAELPLAGDDVDARAHLCVVRTPDGSPVASLRIVAPEDRPFDIERHVELRSVLPADARPAEMSRFAVVPEQRAMGSGVHLAAFAFAFELAARQRWSHFVLMALDDTLAMWRWLQFEPTGLRFCHPGFHDRIAEVMALDLRDVAARYRVTRHALAGLLGRVQDAAVAD